VKGLIHGVPDASAGHLRAAVLSDDRVYAHVVAGSNHEFCQA
jgi:hypothetical protein